MQKAKELSLLVFENPSDSCDGTGLHTRVPTGFPELMFTFQKMTVRGGAITFSALITEIEPSNFKPGSNDGCDEKEGVHII